MAQTSGRAWQDLPVIRLTGKGRRWAKSGHPWIYRDDLAEMVPLPAGELVAVVGPTGDFLGQAFYSATSRIALRLLTRGEEAVDREFWTARLEGALTYREQVAPGVEARRLIYGEADGFPGLVVDAYGPHLAVQTLHPGPERLLPLFLELLTSRLSPASITLRHDAEVRLLEGLALEVRTVQGEVPERLTIREGDLTFRVDVLRGQKTGLFLDQRENRLTARLYGQGEVLDAFAYQGGFGLHLARNARQVTLVDSSAAALEVARENARMNGLSHIIAIRENVFHFLRKAVKEGRRYDTIVLDPPAFAKSRQDRPGALRGYLEINRQALELLAPRGCLITCSCSYNLREEEFLDLLRQAAQAAGRELRLVERRGAARDHPALLSLPESLYLKCFILHALS
jgi:23S rRNA (cytosine1962-C5)-methyltransferase